jgi:hypothetical protein
MGPKLLRRSTKWRATITASAGEATSPFPSLSESSPDIKMGPHLEHDAHLCDGIPDMSEISSVGSGIRCKSVPDPMVGGHLPLACSAREKYNLSLSLECIVDLAKLYGFDDVGFTRYSTLRHWQLCSVDCGWIKFVKYKLAAFMSAHLGGEMPDRPFVRDDKPFILAGGSLGRYIKLLMAGPMANSFAVSVLNSKKGMPRPDHSYVTKAVAETKELLTTLHPCPESPFTSRARFFYELERTVNETFKKKIKNSDLYKPYAPSIKANVVDTRSEFGTFGTLISQGFISDEILPNESGLYSSVMDVARTEEELEDEESTPLRVNDTFRRLVELKYAETYEAARKSAQSEAADVLLVGLPESLKVRTISKGPPLTYFTLKPVQKFLHNQMRKLPVFSLLDRPIDRSQLERFRNRDGLFHSLDYQSATDLLDPEVSIKCAELICEAISLPSDLRLLFLKALTGHSIEGVPQKWGQLMGSIVSFIILCIVNCTVVRFSLEISEKVRFPRLSEVPILINGDDGLVRSGPQYLSVWKSIAASVGLKPSVGKVYSHSSYLNINSTSYEFLNSVFSLIPYTNMGLVYGMKRSGGKQDAINDTWAASIGVRHRTLLETCPWSQRLAVHELFVRRNRTELETYRLPWFIPESLGGLGLASIIIYDYPDPDDCTISTKRYALTSSSKRVGPSRSQVIIALSLRDRVHKQYPVKQLPSSQPILCRSLWMGPVRKLRTGRIWISEHDETFMDLSTYYLSPTLVTTQRDAFYNAILRRNERAWSALMSLVPESPFGDDLFLLTE